MENTKLLEFLWDLAEQLPSLLAALGCLIFALIRWRKHPRVSLLVSLSLGLLFLHAVVSAILYTWIADVFIRAARITDQASVTQNVYLALGLITNGSLAVILAILLMAVFIQRPGNANG